MWRRQHARWTLPVRSAMLVEVTEHPVDSVYSQACSSALPDARRASLEAFIGARFEKAYGARVAHYCPRLVGIEAARGAWCAAAGYAAARDGPLYLEHYLDEPVEGAIGRRLRRSLARDGIVEVGNLAATSPGAARLVIRLMRAHLHRAGFAWVAFTATRELRNTFARLGLPLQSLARADPARVPGHGAGWGDYYAHDPVVVFGSIGEGLVREAAA
jgi:hypothetical protein